MFDIKHRLSKFLPEIITSVSSANTTGSDKVFILGGKLFMYIMKSKGTGIGPCETPYVDLQNTVHLWLLVFAYKITFIVKLHCSGYTVPVNRLYDYISIFKP